MKKLFLSLLFFSPSLLWAQSNKAWVIVPNDDASKVIAIENISFLVTTDNAATFSIVCNNGTIASDISTASFKQTDVSAIQTKMRQNTIPTLSQPCASQLTLTGCPSATPIYIYTVGGRLTYQTITSSLATTIDIASWPLGTYILKMGQTTVKFIKK